jgi:hypothetical protein
MGALAVTSPGGEILPALIYASSLVVSTSSTSAAVSLANTDLVAITVAVLADTWMRIGYAPSVVADGSNGCRLIPAGSIWTEGVRPGAWLAFITVDGSASTACVSVADV